MATLCAALLVPVAAGEAVRAGAGATPRCFGAAARDPLRPCRNPALRARVTPLPDDAILQPEATCAPPPAAPGPPPPCTFGHAEEGATSDVLLLGDSHATHWRPALNVVATALGWHAVSLTRPSCAFNLAAEDVPEPSRSQCLAHNRDVLDYARAHPEVRTVVVSEDHETYRPAGGRSAREEELAGFRAAWQALPATVSRVIVIRDVTYELPSTAGCVTAAHRRHRDAGRACELARSRVLKPDLAMTAARAERASDPSSRVRTVDLTPFLCDRRECFPVVGGVLVHKDVGHLTLLFARTLGPYLLRATEKALAE